jgi:hypothetical protein
MNRIVQSDEEDSKVKRVKSFRIDFPAHRGGESYYLVQGAGLRFTVMKGIPVQWRYWD